MDAIQAANVAALAHRAVLRVGGADARQFLQGIISNDIDKVTADRTVWAALLTPQGKYLHDFFVCQAGDDLLLDCEAGRMDDLMQRLKRFKLRSAVTLNAVEELCVAALFPGSSLEGVAATGETRQIADCVVYADPRLTAAGWRAIGPASAVEKIADQAGASVVEAGVYDRFRISLGLPDGSRDMTIEKTVLLEAGFDELNGVDWTKGCYMGQEVTARTYHRGLVKRRLVPVEFDGPTPAEGETVLAGSSEVGEITSSIGGQGLAMVRIDALANGARLTSGQAELRVSKPSWATF